MHVANIVLQSTAKVALTATNNVQHQQRGCISMTANR